MTWRWSESVSGITYRRRSMACNADRLLAGATISMSMGTKDECRMFRARRDLYLARSIWGLASGLMDIWAPGAWSSDDSHHLGVDAEDGVEYTVFAMLPSTKWLPTT